MTPGMGASSLHAGRASPPGAAAPDDLRRVIVLFIEGA